MADESSLDRFLKNRAAIGLGLVGGRQIILHKIIGAALLLFGLGMFLAPLFGGPPQIVAGAFGPIIGGIVNIGLAYNAKRQIGTAATQDWSLTTEAKGLLLRLIRTRLGWGNPGFGFMHSGEPLVGMPFGMHGKHTRQRLRRVAWMTGQGGFGLWRRQDAEVGEEILGMLNRAAEQFNRVQGMLQTPGNSATLAKVGPSAMRAADDAMGAILNDASTLDKFPESGNSTRKQIEQRISSLKELAERMEDLSSREQSITDKISYSSAMDSVLDELRLEQLARTELQSAETDDNIQQRLQG